MSSVYRKNKTKTRKSKNKIKKPRLTKKNTSYLKKLKLDEELSRNIIKESSTKTPVVAMGHGVKLLSKSRNQLRKGNIGNAMASILTAVAVLSATGPFNKHPNVSESRMSRDYHGRWTGDPDELMKWHMDEQFNHSLKSINRKKGKSIKKSEKKSLKQIKSVSKRKTRKSRVKK